MFSIFQPSRNGHLRRVMTLLEEAHMARIEHQAAAEHHGALGRMYAERAKRLERELYGSSALPAGEGATLPCPDDALSFRRASPV